MADLIVRHRKRTEARIRQNGGAARAAPREPVVTRASLLRGPIEGAPVPPPQTVADLLGGYLGEQCRVILAAEPRLRAGEPVVHPTRVAMRRLRSTLRTFANYVDLPAAAWLEEELVWFAGLLGAVRDLDILAARLDARIAALPPELVLGPVVHTVETEITVRRQPHRAAVIAALDSPRWAELSAALGQWQDAPPFSPAASDSADQAKQDVRRAGKRLRTYLRAALAAADDAAEGTEDLLHRARKAGKRARYAVEAASPLLGAKADKLLDERKQLQDVLGDYQDSVVSAEFLREVGAKYGNRSGRNGFTFGLLFGLEQASRDGLRDRLRQATD